MPRPTSPGAPGYPAFPDTSLQQQCHQFKQSGPEVAAMQVGTVPTFQITLQKRKNSVRVKAPTNGPWVAKHPSARILPPWTVGETSIYAFSCLADQASHYFPGLLNGHLSKKMRVIFHFYETTLHS